MRVLLPFFTALAAIGAATAEAQYGLYGSPEVLRLQQVQGSGAYYAPGPALVRPSPAYTQAYAAPRPAYMAAQQPAARPTPPPPAMQARPQVAPPALQNPPPAQPQPQPAGVVDQMLQEPVPAPATNGYPPPAANGYQPPVANSYPVTPQSLAPAAAPCNGGCFQGNGYANAGYANGGYAGGCANGYGQAAANGYAGDYQAADGYQNGGACAGGAWSGYDDGSGVYSGACGQYAQAAEGYGLGGMGCSPWYAGVYMLYMTRDKANGFWTSYDSNDAANQLMKTNLDWEWRAGGEVRLGRRFCCGAWAVEGVYWGLDSFGAARCLTLDGGEVSTPLRVSEIEFADNDGGPVNGTDFFDNAASHKISRTSEIHNFELNALRHRLAQCGECWNVSWSAGARVFRFYDELSFGSLAGENWNPGGDWGDADGRYEAYLQDKVTNTLVGAQLGFHSEWYLKPTLRFFAAPKFGIFNNHIQHEFSLYRGDGLCGQPTDASGAYGRYPVSSSTDVISFMGQIDIGLEWNFACNWAATIGYRVVAFTNVGLADNQVPYYVVDIPEIDCIDTNGDLILHGAFAGLQYNF